MSTAPRRHRSGHGVPVAGLGQPVQFCVQVSPPAAPALRSRRGSSRSTRCGGGPAAQPRRSCARHRPLRARISDNARHSCGDRLSCYQQVSYLVFTNSPARAIVIPALSKASTHGLARCTVCATQAVREAIYAMFLRMSAVSSTSRRPVPRQLIEVILNVPFRLGPRSFSVWRFTNRIRFQFDLKGRR